MIVITVACAIILAGWLIQRRVTTLNVERRRTMVELKTTQSQNRLLELQLGTLLFGCASIHHLCIYIYGIHIYGTLLLRCAPVYSPGCRHGSRSYRALPRPWANVCMSALAVSVSAGGTESRTGAPATGWPPTIPARVV